MLNARKQSLMSYAISEQRKPRSTCAFMILWFEHSLFVDIYYSIHWFCKRAMQALISLRECAGWSGHALSANCIRTLFVRCASNVSPYCGMHRSRCKDPLGFTVRNWVFPHMWNAWTSITLLTLRIRTNTFSELLAMLHSVGNTIML